MRKVPASDPKQLLQVAFDFLSEKRACFKLLNRWNGHLRILFMDGVGFSQLDRLCKVARFHGSHKAIPVRCRNRASARFPTSNPVGSPRQTIA